MSPQLWSLTSRDKTMKHVICITEAESEGPHSMSRSSGGVQRRNDQTQPRVHQGFVGKAAIDICGETQ